MAVRKRRDKGVVLVEFALVLPVFILILIGTVEFGIVLHDYLILENASREGARYGAVGNSETAITQRVRDFSFGLNSSNVNVTVSNAQGPRGSTVTVRTTYPVPLLTALMQSLAGSSTFNLESDAYMRQE